MYFYRKDEISKNSSRILKSFEEVFDFAPSSLDLAILVSSFNIPLFALGIRGEQLHLFHVSENNSVSYHINEINQIAVVNGVLTLILRTGVQRKIGQKNMFNRCIPYIQELNSLLKHVQLSKETTSTEDTKVEFVNQGSLKSDFDSFYESTAMKTKVREKAEKKQRMKKRMTITWSIIFGVVITVSFAVIVGVSANNAWMEFYDRARNVREATVPVWNVVYDAINGSWYIDDVRFALGLFEVNVNQFENLFFDVYLAKTTGLYEYTWNVKFYEGSYSCDILYLKVRFNYLYKATNKEWGRYLIEGK